MAQHGDMFLPHPHTDRFGVPVSGVRDGAPMGDRPRKAPRAMRELVGGRFAPIGGGAPGDEVPGNDFAQLDDGQLQEALDAAISQFDELSQADVVTEQTMQQLRDLTTQIQSMRGEQETRREAAEAAQREIEEMANLVRGADPNAEDPDAETPAAEDEPSVDPAETPSADEVAPAETAPTAEVTPAIAASSRPLHIGGLRRQRRRVDPPKEKNERAVTITAAADVPGVDTGEDVDIETLVGMVTARARGIKSKGGARNTALVASYRLPFSPDLIVDNIGDAASGTAALVAAADQSRLPTPHDLVASGGWCAPSETVYDIADFACPDMLWSPPEIQLRRGGLRYIPTPALVVDDLTWEWTEDDDIDAADDEDIVKPCFHVPCPTFVDRRARAIGACIESGILTERAFPELTSWYTRNAMIAHEITLKARMWLAAINDPLTIQIENTATMAAFTAVFGAVLFQMADMTEKLSMCDSTGIEVAFPWWVQKLFLADIARQNGRSLEEIDPNVIARVFQRAGATVSFARGVAPAVPDQIGGSDIEDGWPSTVSFLLYPAGAFQIGRGDVVDLGVVQDSEKFKRNDYTALFTEETVALIGRGPEARYVTVPICPDGTTGGQATSDVDIDCPVDGGTSGS